MAHSKEIDPELVKELHDMNLTQSSQDIRTFVFTAIATTGFPTRADPTSAKITQLCFLPVDVEKLTRKEVKPKVLNKLTLSFNPEKEIHPKAVEASGLTNEYLKDFPTFDEQARQVIDFLHKLPKPVCLVAHQGDQFHFRLLFLHLSATIPVGEFKDFSCTDSLKVAKELAPKLKSKSLDNVYKELCGGDPKIGADGRCEMLLEVVGNLNENKFNEFYRLCQRIKWNFSERRFDVTEEYSNALIR